MPSILRAGPVGESGAPIGTPLLPRPRSYYRFGFVALIVSDQQSSVPTGWSLSSSSTSSDQVALVAFLSPSPFRSAKLSAGAEVPARGAGRPGVRVGVGLLVSSAGWE